MSKGLTTTNDLIIVDAIPLDQHPAAVYVAGLAAGSRRTRQAALDKTESRPRRRAVGAWALGIRHSYQMTFRELYAVSM